MASPEGTNRFRKRHEGKTTTPGHYREFDGIQLSTLGMGTYLGGIDNDTDEQVTRAVRDSITSGSVNVIDTAINYRNQKAERSVGRGLDHLFSENIVERDEIFVSTKNGYLSPDADVDLDPQTYIYEKLIKPGIIDPDQVVDSSHCMSRTFLKDQLDRSLSNLGLKKVDLIYLHNSAESQLPVVGRENFLSRLRIVFQLYEEERSRGRITYYGLATWSCFRVEPSSPEYLNLEDIVKLAKEVGGPENGFKFVQLPYNLAMVEALELQNQKVQEEKLTFLQAAIKLKMGIFTSVPLLQGRLLNDPMDIQGLKSRSLACLQFVRSSPGVIAPMVGQKSPEHVKENLALANIPPYDLEKFKSIYGKS